VNIDLNSGLVLQYMWTVPVRGVAKCNVDATIFKNKNCFSADIWVRYVKGERISQPTPKKQKCGHRTGTFVTFKFGFYSSKDRTRYQNSGGRQFE